MVQMQLMRGLRAIMACLIAIQLPLVQVDSTGNDSPEWLRWEITPETVIFEANQATTQQLEYQLTVSSEWLNSSTANQSGGLLFSYGLPEGLAFVVEKAEAVKTSGNEIVIRDQNGEQIAMRVEGQSRNVEWVVGELSVDRDQLRFRASLAPKEEQQTAAVEEERAEIEEHDDPVEMIVMTVTVFTGAIQVKDGFESGELVLTVSSTDQQATAITKAVRLMPAQVEPEPSGAEAPPIKAAVSPMMEIVARQGFTRNIFWADNNNELGQRQSREDFATEMGKHISFVLNGKTYLLNDENMKLIGLTGLPEAEVSEAGVNAYTISYPSNAFPTLLRDEEGMEYPVKWHFVAPAFDGYDAVDVNEANFPYYPSLHEQGEAAYGWYYLLKISFHFHLVLHTGASYNESGNFSNEALKEAVLEHFNLCIERPYHDPMNMLLKDMEGGVLAFEVNADDGGDDMPDEADKMATVIITNSWKYNVNGERMVYKLIQKIGESDTVGWIAAVPTDDAPEDIGEDRFKITYDNSGTSYASQTDAVYSDGKLYLTLCGEEVYQATKIWQDQGVVDVVRPAATLELWRYRNGEDFESATPVRNSQDKIVKLQLPPRSQERVVPIEFKADDRLLLESLPKYDSEGYRYVYVIKEYLSGENADKYRQVFGTIRETAPGSGKYVIEDTLPTWLPIIEGTTRQRADNNHYVYDGGTLSNCLSVNTQTSGSKVWKAASFQADFENVIVELTLQYRPKTEDGNGMWSDAVDQDGKVMKTAKFGFNEEELASWDVAFTSPKYGALGRRLEFRWVETAVYQPFDIDPNDKAALQAWYERQSANDSLLDAQTGTFTLHQNGRDIRYQSVTNMVEDDHQVIINQVQNTISYMIEKKWSGGINPHQVSFSIFRIECGNMLNAQTPAYITFTLDEAGHIQSFDLPDGVTIRNSEDEAWNVVLEHLPEFDENGASYQYVLLEKQDGYWMPDYQTVIEDDKITTVVTNGPGSGQRIMVRKEWIDDSDIGHREPVTIEVWRKDGVQPLASAVLNATNDWNSLVSIGDESGQAVNLDEVYIKEVRAGIETAAKEVVYENGDWQRPTAAVGHYTSDYHNYEVSYVAKQDVLGETVFTVCNRRVNTVNLTAIKLWKDNDGVFREALQKALKRLPDDKKVNLSVRLTVANDRLENHRIFDDANNRGLVDVGLDAPSVILDQDGKPVSHIQALQLEREESRYAFYNLPKYDAGGAMVHYTAEEIWQDGSGTIIPDLAQYLSENLPGYPDRYPDLEQALREYVSFVSDESYTAGRITERVAAPWSLLGPDTIIAPDEQTIEFTNRLSGVKSVWWHKLWNDSYAYSQGNRPDIYLDIFQMAHEEDENGNLVQVVRPYMRDYRWDSSTNADVEHDVLDKGNDKNHWHVVLDNLPKYDAKTGREYYYYAVEQAKINIKQFDYTDVGYYTVKQTASKQNSNDGSNDDWPVTITDQMVQMGTAHGTIDEEYLRFDDRQPAWVFAVPEAFKVAVPSHKHYQYPDYMLLEDGYFSNALKKDTFIEGQKLWGSLPHGYSNLNLPSVQFGVYRTLDTGNRMDEGTRDIADMEFVALLVVKDWAGIHVNGTYRFVIDHYTNANGEAVDETGKVVDQIEQAAKLPQYNEKGQAYRYTLIEDRMIWADGTATAVCNPTAEDGRTGIFNTIQPGSRDFVATNAYVGIKGSLAAKKLLKLETKVTNGVSEYVYPAVKFRLERFYYPNDRYVNGKPIGIPVKDEYFHQEKIWTSKEVKAAHTGSSEWVSNTIIFENLEQYAPNGSTYWYTVTEDKEHLGGYATWAARGDFDDPSAVKKAGRQIASLGGLTVKPNDTADDMAAVTFLNEYEREKPERYPVVLQKVWRDYNDAFGLRPDEIELSMYRYADAQPGQGNGIRQDFATIVLPTQPDHMEHFRITFEAGIEGYVATAIRCFLTNTDVYVNGESKYENGWQWTLESFERYAPNGMPWKYVIKERDPGASADNPYQYNRGTATGWWNIKDGKVINHLLPSLINSLYASVSFEKQWQDEAGNPITADYLGKDLTSTFVLEVKAENADVWRNAADYFLTALDETTLETLKENGGAFATDLAADFVKTIRGRISDSIWRGRYNELPMVIRNRNGDLVRLEYRVVESSFAYGESSAAAVTIKPDGLSYTIAPNGLLSEAAFTANGNVTTNKLHTTSFTVWKIWVGDSFNQYRTRPKAQHEDFSWETVFVVQRRSDDHQPWQDVTSMILRGNNTDSAEQMTISGLPIADANGKTYHYRAREQQPEQSDLVENSGDSYYNGAYLATYEETAGNVTAVNRLKSGTDISYSNYAAEKNWIPAVPPSGEGGREAVFALQYRDKRTKNWETLTTVTLDGKQDDLAEGDDTQGLEQMAYGEDRPWHAIWRNVPQFYPYSDIPEQTAGTIYRVVEISHKPGTYIEERTDVTADKETCTFLFTNIQSTHLAVKKHWLRIDENEHNEVVVGLYRTIDAEQIGSADETLAVKADGKPVIQSLHAPDWQTVFEDLAAYDGDGQRYYYYALERSIDGTSLADGEIGALYDFETKPNTTEITNVPTISIGGTKIWLDDGNRDGKRPDDLTLVLKRSKGTMQDWETVDAEPVWKNTDQDSWEYTFDQLPEISADSLIYHYRVEEVVPEGYVQRGGSESNTLINVRSGVTEMTVTKQWICSNEDDLPELHLILYRSTDGLNGADQKSVDDATVTLIQNKTTWTYTFSGLPKYNDNGILYTYWVEEIVPEGYDARTTIASDGGTLENYRQGTLQIGKKVSGKDGETDRAFAFRVTLTGTAWAGIDAAEVNGDYGGVRFEKGIAEFTLMHNEEKWISGLPAGLTYTVTELDANRHGYVTSSYHAKGAVPSGMVQIRFTNKKNTPLTSDSFRPEKWKTIGLLLLGALLLLGRKKRDDQD